MPIRLVVADDHPLLLDGLERLFAGGAEFVVVARCADGTEALAAVRAHRPDILLLDLQMPRTDGLEVLRELAREGPPTRVVVLTAGFDERQTLEAMRLGVKGVVLKSMPPELLLRCLRKVHEGGHWLERQSTGRLIESLLLGDTEVREAGRVLTARELEIVRLAVRGARNQEIAERLEIGPGTVKTHLYNIYRKTGVGSRLELLRWAEARGFG